MPVQNVIVHGQNKMIKGLGAAAPFSFRPGGGLPPRSQVAGLYIKREVAGRRSQVAGRRCGNIVA